jgi:hypothetical protein
MFLCVHKNAKRKWKVRTYQFLVSFLDSVKICYFLHFIEIHIFFMCNYICMPFMSLKCYELFEGKKLKLCSSVLPVLPRYSTSVCFILLFCKVEEIYGSLVSAIIPQVKYRILSSAMFIYCLQDITLM